MTVNFNDGMTPRDEVSKQIWDAHHAFVAAVLAIQAEKFRQWDEACLPVVAKNAGKRYVLIEIGRHMRFLNAFTRKCHATLDH